MSRFEEVVNEAIGEVILGETGLQGRGAGPAHRRARARAPGRAARRGHDRRALPRAQAGARVGHPDAGDLHAVRLGGRVRARHAPARRRRGAGHDRLPVRAAARRRRARASAWPTTASPTTRSSASSRRVPVATHNQRGLGTLHIGCPEDCDGRDRGGDAAGDRRGLDVERDLRADEALRRGRGRREGPPPPALRRGLRARDDRRRRRALRRPRRRTRSSRPARRTSRRSTSTTSSPSASALLGELRHELRRGEHLAHHTSMREWLDAAGR